MSVKCDPLEDRVIVQPDPQTADEAAKRQAATGVVVAVGPGREINGQRWKMSVSLGDRVTYPAGAGCLTTFDGVEYVIISEREILTRAVAASD